MKELQRELKGARDKLIQQEQAAKAGLMQMQKETTYRLEQVKGQNASPIDEWRCSAHPFVAGKQTDVFHPQL